MNAVPITEMLQRAEGWQSWAVLREVTHRSQLRFLAKLKKVHVVSRALILCSGPSTLRPINLPSPALGHLRQGEQGEWSSLPGQSERLHSALTHKTFSPETMAAGWELGGPMLRGTAGRGSKRRRGPGPASTSGIISPPRLWMQNPRTQRAD